MIPRGCHRGLLFAIADNNERESGLLALITYAHATHQQQMTGRANRGLAQASRVSPRTDSPSRRPNRAPIEGGPNAVATASGGDARSGRRVCARARPIDAIPLPREAEWHRYVRPPGREVRKQLWSELTKPQRDAAVRYFCDRIEGAD